MKVDHSRFEAMLVTKEMTKKAFSQYAKIPYYTVAGWKKSGKVPAYVMVLLENIPSSNMVTAQQLIDAGMPRAIFWNNDLTKAVPKDIFIVATLRRSYNDFVVRGFIKFFGEETVLASLMKHRVMLSETLLHHVTRYIDD